MANYQVQCRLNRYGAGYLEVITDRGDVETYYVYSKDWAAFEAWIDHATEWVILWVDQNGFVTGWQ